MSSPVGASVPLGPQWPTIDPFLFCAHHHDDYPRANASMGPATSLDGRDIGADFSGLDGWNMYHGDTVPGFPQHPHRGFETVTFVRRGVIDHSDSLGASARFGSGDAQWLTAGAGIVHSEMFPLLDPDDANPLELFQIWLNLPRTDKLVEPYFTMLWGHDIPEDRLVDTDGGVTVVTMITGDDRAGAPPPNSWAARPDAGVRIWQIRMDPGARYTLPAPAVPSAVQTLYLFDGTALQVADRRIEGGHGVTLDPGDPSPTELVAGSDGASLLVLGGTPIGEPVQQYGPFVMNTRAEINQAMQDYQRTGFGGWPWPTDDPTHGHERIRFAVHPDGHRDDPPPDERAL